MKIVNLTIPKTTLTSVVRPSVLSSGAVGKPERGYREVVRLPVGRIHQTVTENANGSRDDEGDGDLNELVLVML